MNDMYEEWGIGICELCDEQLEETKLLGHNYSHKGYSMLYLHQGIKDEIMVLVYHETEDTENKVEDLEKCEDQLTKCYELDRKLQKQNRREVYIKRKDRRKYRELFFEQQRTPLPNW